MNKLIIALILSLYLFPLNSYAKWIKISEANKGVIFVDPNTIRATGTSRFVWQLYDFNLPQYNNNALSMKFYTEIECDLKQYRTIKYATYELSMGNGDALDIKTVNDKWSSIKQQSYGMDLLDIVCKFSSKN